MSTATNDAVSIAIASAAHELAGNSADYDPLLALISDARFVLLGEATHGTREFYEERTKSTQRLISECVCSAVAVEADWPDAYRPHRYARGEDSDGAFR